MSVELPEIRIVVEPYEGLWNRWRWAVCKRRDGIDGDGFYVIWDNSGGILRMEGHARTEEKALARARKRAAEYCEKLLEMRVRQQRIERGKYIEKVTCEGGM